MTKKFEYRFIERRSFMKYADELTKKMNSSLEYKLNRCVMNGINQLGDEGWEFVQMIEEPSITGPVNVYIFKREKYENQEDVLHLETEGQPEKTE